MSHQLDLIGQKFGRLTVINKVDRRTKDGMVIWNCKCDCGNYKETIGTRLKGGRTKSCGCLSKESTVNANLARKLKDRTMPAFNSLYGEYLRSAKTRNIKFHLTKEGKALIIFSSLTKKGKIDKIIRKNNEL